MGIDSGVSLFYILVVVGVIVAKGAPILFFSTSEAKIKMGLLSSVN
jgi:hypothetical protein